MHSSSRFLQPLFFLALFAVASPAYSDNPIEGFLYLYIDPSAEEIYFSGSDSGTPKEETAGFQFTLEVSWDNGASGGVFLTSLLLNGDSMATEQDGVDVGFLGAIDIYDGYLIIDFQGGNHLDVEDAEVVFTGLEKVTSYSGLSVAAKTSLESIDSGGFFFPDDTPVDPDDGIAQSGYGVVIVGIVPEPSTCTLLGLGFVACFIRRRRLSRS